MKRTLIILIFLTGFFGASQTYGPPIKELKDSLGILHKFISVNESTDDQQLSLSGNTLTLEDGGFVNMFTNNIDYYNASSGLAATNAQEAIDYIASFVLLPTDAGSTSKTLVSTDWNKWHYTTNTINLTLDDSGPIGGRVSFQPTGVGNVITVTPAAGVTFVGNGNQTINGAFTVSDNNVGWGYKLASNLISVGGAISSLVASGVPVIESFDKAWYNGTSPSTVNIPAGNTGDLLLVIVGDDEADTATATFDANDDPVGWTFEGEFGDTVSDTHMGIYSKIADGSEGATADFQTTSTDSHISILRISGVDQTDPVGIIGTQQTNSPSSTTVIPEITTTLDNSLIIGAASTDGSDMNYVSLSGTGWVYGDSAEGADLADNTNGTWISKPMPTAGATGSPTITFSGADGLLSVMIEIKSQ